MSAPANRGPDAEDLSTPAQPTPSSPLSGVEALPGSDRPSRKVERLLTRYLLAGFGFSVVVNLLFLVSPMYMMQVYGRVISTGSHEVLITLTFIAVCLLLLYIAAEGARKRTLARAGQLLGESIDGLTLRRGLGSASTPSTKTLAAIGNLSRLQGLLLQGNIAPLFDIPFIPFFIGLLFVIHPLLGTVGLLGAITLIGLAIVTDKTSRRAVEEAGQRDQKAQSHLSHMVRQRAAIVSMGMTDRAVGHWQHLRRDAIDSNIAAAAGPTFLSATTRSVRQILQVFILGAGAVLVIGGVTSGGVIIAGSIIMGRGLAPIDQTVAIWRQVILARKSWNELKDWIDNEDADIETVHSDAATAMPRPAPILKFEEFAVGIPGMDKPLLPQMTLEMNPGTMVALLGPSGSGKTSFLQSLAGAWPAQNGTVRLGGRDIATWDARDRGRYVGYLPQHVELLTGTVFENICRFSDCDPDEVFDAAKRVGCHDMILTLPKGYDTPVGEGGAHLSAGQRQSIGLARAFFGDPALLLLDEPTAHLDANLAARLMAQFAELARKPQGERRATAIIATHDLRLINAADNVMVIKDRKIAISPREEYLRKVSDLRAQQAQRLPQQSQPAPVPTTKSGGDE